MRTTLPVLLWGALLPVAAGAQTGDIAQAIRTADWANAASLATAYADPVGAKLVTYYRLLHAGDARVGEIAAFLDANPDWPQQATLLKRRDEALAAESDDMVVLPLCTATPAVPSPASGAALARCATAEAAAGHADDAAAAARAAWVAGLPDRDSEQAFLAVWAGTLTPPDEAARFRVLLANRPDLAAIEITRLAPGERALARARLAVRTNAADEAALVARLPDAVRHDPGLILDQVRALRRGGQEDAALAVWRSDGFAAERTAGAAGAPNFWAERSALARRRLATGDNQGAYDLANDTLQTEAEPAADAAFLAGFIALRRLNQPTLAGPHFQLLAKSGAAISQARAHYWLARVAEATNDPAAAHSEYAAAAAWPTTYYGQLAMLASGGNDTGLEKAIDALSDPAWTGAQALAFAGRELPRAAAMLVAWGDPARARAFLQQVAAEAADPQTRALTARFADGLGLPDQAVAVARKAGRDGTMLPDAGWPMSVHPGGEAVAEAVALGIIRQESSFDTGAVSPSGARGLMQLMPATAVQVGRRIGSVVPVASLTTDADGNMRLGTAYLGQLVDRFGGALPLAIAAYNAGPSRVDQWLADNGDPRGHGRDAMIDWIELIPFSETRNYVQRVTENIGVYRAKRHEVLPYPVGA